MHIRLHATWGYLLELLQHARAEERRVEVSVARRAPLVVLLRGPARGRQVFLGHLGRLVLDKLERPAARSKRAVETIETVEADETRDVERSKRSKRSATRGQSAGSPITRFEGGAGYSEPEASPLYFFR